ncbi:ABC transporter ATP-binding protein [Bartonella sp. HY761]|uniref:ABC transporter ATP-binding protein n=1 Tax=Bartonella sp. HY761 TaxID=2979330 RepID=UPI0021FA1FC4|nr:ABC transporter ATP-binding protein [Bartonella sp. HY761]UXN08073.1 ABC transporter ATP-binding protein [Bartonella sp. HY761]
MVGRSFTQCAFQDEVPLAAMPMDNILDAREAPQQGDIVLAGENISISHDGKTTILTDFSLTLRQGEIVSILGPSGVGKSSLLRILGGLERAQNGVVKIHGEEISKVHPRLSMAFQNPCLLPWLNVYKNVAFGLNFKHQPTLKHQVRHQRIERALREVNLEDAGALMPAQLSGGMASRVALARCLARQPDVLLLDEPFGALDAITRGQMQQLLIKIISDYQSAALLITHDIDEALRVSDRVLLIGGTPGQLLGEWDLTHLRQSGNDSLAALAIQNEIMQKLAH